jgi:gas vesicle protein
MKNYNKILIALAAGAVAGALAGVLMAPDKGRNTRKMLKEESQKIVDQLFDELAEDKARFSNVKKQISQVIKVATMCHEVEN